MFLTKKPFRHTEKIAEIDSYIERGVNRPPPSPTHRGDSFLALSLRVFLFPVGRKKQIFYVSLGDKFKLNNIMKDKIISP